MERFRCLFEDFRRALGFAPRVELSDFQKAKLLHEFRTFYDVNKDGRLQWKDFEMVKEYICSKSGWKVSSPQWQRCRELFIELWRNLQDTGDENTDGDITSEEWIVLWKKIYAAKIEHSRSACRWPPGSSNKDVPGSDESGSPVDQEYIPNWFRKYIEYKFYLLDRAGDGVIDVDEFEYALGDFDIPPNDCRTAFRLMSQNGQKKIDMAYFRELALQFYLSNDPSDLGNFINGKLSYD